MLLRLANLALLVLFPVAWFAPLMKAGLLPLFKLSEISVISGLQSLWGRMFSLLWLSPSSRSLRPISKHLALPSCSSGCSGPWHSLRSTFWASLPWRISS